MNILCALQHHEWNHKSALPVKVLLTSAGSDFSTIPLSFMIRPHKRLGRHLKLILFIMALVHEQLVCASLFYACTANDHHDCGFCKC